MLQIAIFVDAGYLYAQGSVLLTGEKKKQHEIRLDVAAVIEALRVEALRAAESARLLRVYWYDGLGREGRLNAEQSLIAHSPNVKLRLGRVNSYNEQKGVDSLIITDMIDLARNGAMTDALILSGDEDVRVGVQVAQTFGVRVHLLGIEPARGSQSPDLVQEADTTNEWKKSHISNWMTVEQQIIEISPKMEASDNSSPENDYNLTDLSNSVIEEVIGSIKKDEIKTALKFIEANRNSIPPEYDRRMLGRLKAILGRELTSKERSEHRNHVASEIRKRAVDHPT